MNKKINIDTKTFIRFWLVILGFALLALFIWKAQVGIILTLVSLFIAIAITPLINKVSKIIPVKGRTIPVLLSFTLVVVILGAIFSIITPAIINESIKFVKTLPSTASSLSHEFSGLNTFVQDRFGIYGLDKQIENNVQQFSSNFVKNAAPNVISSINAISDAAAKIILILAMTLFMLLEGPKLTEAFWSHYAKNPRLMRYKYIIHRMADMVARYVSGTLIVCLIDAIVTGIVIFIFSFIFKFDPGLTLPFALITGLGNLIPIFGPTICCFIVAILLAFSSVPAAIAFVIFLVIYLQIESNFISPKVQSKGTKLPALIILIAVTVGVYMIGIVGAVIAIPIAGAIKIILEEYSKTAALMSTKSSK